MTYITFSSRKLRDLLKKRQNKSPFLYKTGASTVCRAYTVECTEDIKVLNKYNIVQSGNFSTHVLMIRDEEIYLVTKKYLLEAWQNIENTLSLDCIEKLKIEELKSSIIN